MGMFLINIRHTSIKLKLDLHTCSQFSISCFTSLSLRDLKPYL